jgi:AraC-like DNA-binding protein
LNLIGLLFYYSISYFFWLFTQSIFRDDFKINKIHAYLFIAINLLYFALHFQRRHNFFFQPADQEEMNLITTVVYEVVSSIFVVLALIESQVRKAQDLIASRIKFRRVFFPICAIVILLTNLSGTALRGAPAPDVLELIQKVMILGGALGFIIYRIELKPGFFLEKPSQTNADPISIQEQTIIGELESLMFLEKFYMSSGLTIRELSEKINYPEHKLRKVINQYLGYKNFNEYLNRFRIKEAQEILENPEFEECTILEISYKLGYQSISSFNRAFKSIVGSTPTEFRRKSMT